MTDPETFEEELATFVRAQSPGADVADVRDERLQRVLQQAAESVPLYRDLYRERKIDIGTIKTPNDLWKLPAIDKSDMVRAGPERYTDGFYDCDEAFMQRTSGSTGPPLPIYAKSYEAWTILASLWSGWMSNSLTNDDRMFLLHARQISYLVPSMSSTFCSLEMPMNKTIVQFRRFAPTVVIGLTESVPLLAAELLQRDVPQRRNVRTVFVMGDTLTPQLRQMIASAFDCEIFNLFGAAEVGWIGCECDQHNGFHIPEDRVVVQIARSNQPNESASPGEVGEVIVTSLLRLTTPFVRYRLYDAAAIDRTPCPCGRTSPRLVNVEGRMHDFLIATDGHGVPAMRIGFDIWLHRSAVLDYQVVQTEPQRLHISLVVDPKLPAVDVDDIKQAMRKSLGDIEVTVEFVSEIPRQISGKRRRIYRTFDLP